MKLMLFRVKFKRLHKIKKNFVLIMNTNKIIWDQGFNSKRYKDTISRLKPYKPELVRYKQINRDFIKEVKICSMKCKIDCKKLKNKFRIHKKKFHHYKLKNKI